VVQDVFVGQFEQLLLTCAHPAIMSLKRTFQ
jgi:hypothetical protein